MAKKIVRPQYETKHEEMLAKEREYTMNLQDESVAMAGTVRGIGNAISAMNAIVGKIIKGSEK